jgi:hypothetical protein
MKSFRKEIMIKEPSDQITGMNPKARFGYYTLRCAGLFNLPISLHCVMEIGVSRIPYLPERTGRARKLLPLDWANHSRSPEMKPK